MTPTQANMCRFWTLALLATACLQSNVAGALWSMPGATRLKMLPTAMQPTQTKPRKTGSTYYFLDAYIADVFTSYTPWPAFSSLA
jgi:hypothetical protein